MTRKYDPGRAACVNRLIQPACASQPWKVPHGIRGQQASRITSGPIRHRSPIRAPLTSTPFVVRFSPNTPLPSGAQLGRPEVEVDGQLELGTEPGVRPVPGRGADLGGTIGHDDYDTAVTDTALIEPDVLERVLSTALQGGGDMAEVFAEDAATSGAMLDDRRSRGALVRPFDRGAGSGSSSARPPGSPTRPT